MSDLPSRIEISEEGPREGFQIEPGPIATADKIDFVNTLSDTGLRDIQVCSFVSARLVPGWADADDVVAGFIPRDGVTYRALWFNEKCIERALRFSDKLALEFGDERRRLALTRQPPSVGQHSSEVMLEAGFSSTDIDALSSSGILLDAACQQ